MQSSLPVPFVLAVAGAVLVVVLVAAATAHWVYRDARARESDSPALWAVFAAAGGLGLALYLLYRGRLGARTRPYTQSERLALSVWVSVTATFVIAAVLAPPDPFTQVIWAGLGAPLAFGVVYALARLRLPVAESG